MKKTYLKPEIRTANILGDGFLASSNTWSENGETGDFSLNDGTASNPTAASRDFSFWDNDDAW